jgi:hypothetical protein
MVKKLTLIRNLKLSIKDLKSEIQKLYEENAVMQRNLKSTKLMETEIEI